MYLSTCHCPCPASGRISLQEKGDGAEGLSRCYHTSRDHQWHTTFCSLSTCQHHSCTPSSLRHGGGDQSFTLLSTNEHKSPLHTGTESCSPSLSVWDALFLPLMGKLLMWSHHSPSCCSPNSCLIKQKWHDHEQTLQNPRLPTGISQTTNLPIATTPQRE